jgi:hypothetical protein
MITPSEPTASETSNPTPSDIPISAAGQALREQLTKVTAEHAARKVAAAHPGAKDFGAEKPGQPPTETPTATSGDGEIVDLTTGEVTKPQAADYTIVPETELLPSEYHEPAAQLATDLEALGEDKGYSRELVQTALDAGIDIFMSGERDLGVDTREKCINVLTTKYGEEAASELIRQAHAQAKHLGPAAMKWLDESGIGNSPAGIAVLAAQYRGDLAMSPDAAKSLIKDLRSGPKANDKAVIDRVRILSRVANPKGAPKAEQPSAPSYFSTSPSGHPVSTLSPLTTGRQAQSLEAQLNEINLNPDLYSSDATKRKPLIARRAQLQAAIAAKKRSK